MAKHDERDELDRLLDSALASYSDAEPLAGIEQRVMHRIAGSKRRPWLWWMAGAVTATACLVLLLTSRETIAPAPLPIAPRRLEVAEKRPEPVIAPRPMRPRPVRRPQPAKKEQFPAATPLTGEEQRLLQLAAIAGEVLQTPPLTAIQIEPIQIEPLDTNGTN